jgi:hypothetical protein
LKTNSSVLIIDEDYEKLHNITRELAGKNFHLIESDNVNQIIDYFSGREFPYLVFLSDTIQNRNFLVRILKKFSTKHEIIPIHQKDYVSDGTSITRPYSSADFLEIIRNELEITEEGQPCEILKKAD